MLDSRVVLHPHVTAADLDPPDLVVIPGLDDDLAPSFQRNRTWVPWIAKWHAAGSRVATSCTGAFLAADAGVLDGKEATTHWIAADAFRRRFPRVLLTPERMLVDASRPPPARRPAPTCNGSASRRPGDCWKPPPTPSTTSEPRSATATRRRSDARSATPPGWVLDNSGRSTARDDTR
jgi:hypothetical protein